MNSKRSVTTDFDVGARLREIREQHQLSQRDLAERAGIPMTMVEFFEPESRPRRVDQVFFRPRELIDLTLRLTRRNSVSTRGSLSLRQVGDARTHNLQILHETYGPGADTGEAMLEHDSSEGGVVISGELEITVADQVRVLKPGDAFLFSSRKPHRFRNPSSKVAVVVSACTPPYL
jgi:mannose-6-phosphate isomerase-like protein (cupin superfamily)